MDSAGTQAQARAIAAVNKRHPQGLGSTQQCVGRQGAASSFPGPIDDLMSEAISYIAGAQVPAAFVNIVRAGPGLGGICPHSPTTSKPPKAEDTATTDSSSSPPQACKKLSTFNLDNNPKMLVVAYGTMARICSTAITELKAEGIEVGLLRPITLFPFPTPAIAELGKKIGRVMSIEMNETAPFSCSEDQLGYSHGMEPASHGSTQQAKACLTAPTRAKPTRATHPP